LLLVEVVTLGNRNKTLWSESSFTVNKHGFASATTLTLWHLAGDAECVAQLSLPCSKLAKQLSDTSSFNPASEQLIWVLATCA